MLRGSSNGPVALANIIEPKGIEQTASASVYFEASDGFPGAQREARDLHEREDRLQEDRCQSHRLQAFERNIGRPEVNPAPSGR